MQPFFAGPNQPLALLVLGISSPRCLEIVASRCRHMLKRGFKGSKGPVKLHPHGDAGTLCFAGRLLASTGLKADGQRSTRYPMKSLFPSKCRHLCTFFSSRVALFTILIPAFLTGCSHDALSFRSPLPQYIRASHCLSSVSHAPCR